MSITQGLHRSLNSSPHTTATRCGDRVRSFQEHADRVGRLAAGLRSLGLEPGDRVSILAVNSDRFIEILLACAWSGLVFNPLNVRWSALELEYGLADAGSRTLAVDDQFLEMARHLHATDPTRQLLYIGDGPCPPDFCAADGLIAANNHVPDAHVPDASTAGLFYTGGTTGLPRGVVLTHGNLLASALGSLASGDILAPGPVLHVAPLFHLAGIWPWLLQLIRGGSHVILPGFDPAQVVTAVNQWGVTNLFMVPTMVQRFLEYLNAAELEVPTLRRVQYAGSPMPAVVLDRFQATLPDVDLCQVYGMTELAPVATVLLPHEHRGARRGSAGRPAAHELVHVVDPAGDRCGHGEVGEIVVQGPNVMAGYWNRPEETAIALRDGWMHTGDAGYFDEDGYLYVVDRIKDMIVTGGENVYSVEVENAVMSHPAVVSCAVVGAPDEAWGERVHAVVVLRADATLELAALREHVTALIARYKAPRTMQVVDALPVSAAGKILKRELRADLVCS